MESKSKTYYLASVGIMAAVICILGPLSIPIGVVPISFTNLAIYFALYTIGMKKGTISYIIYMLIGSMGAPVFSSFTGGPAKLVGPTGGYLVGFIFMALISGFFIDTFFEKRYLCFAGMVLGTVVCYMFGTVWLAYQANISISKALSLGVISFIPGDLAKIASAAIVGPQIRKSLIKANLYMA